MRIFFKRIDICIIPLENKKTFKNTKGVGGVKGGGGCSQVLSPKSTRGLARFSLPSVTQVCEFFISMLEFVNALFLFRMVSCWPFLQEESERPYFLMNITP